MSYPAELDARGLHEWAARTVEELQRRRAEINALNVFPVPDSDTGSNMAHTMASALAEADKGEVDVAEALAIGSVRGARGNSGMVLSQVLRGVADATTDSRVDGAVLADALTLAVTLVDRALAAPVEGTIITVLRAAATAASEAAGQPGAQLHGILVAALDAARQALAQTPSQLPALREAGVVDAGGTGFVILLECLLAQVTGEEPANPPLSVSTPAKPEGLAEIEVVFFFEGNLAEVEQALAPLGNSLVIARATDASGSVHIHSSEAGTVIEEAYGLGKVSNLRLEALPPAEAGACATEHSEGESPQRRIFAAVPEGAARELFEKAGARAIGPGEDLENAVVGDLFLPNGCGGDPGRATVIPTGSIVAGLAALSVYSPNPSRSAEVVAAMSDAARSMRVAHPETESLDGIIAACRTQLAYGGEQVTVLTGCDINAEELTQILGVDVVVLRVPGLRTEIGVE
ncbi:DAK2 domain-containing protein [Corynebacterium hesseae]|uniref:DAK2 domain-containing protein n=1 Tax=Corynebacterium hesseae TaxID=2913502 RepID=A0ABU9UIW8_9CORY|nr:DAK2 domain-containing protein [Corynebacterium hesseae]MCZ9297749.1 DAK2 domain-containing protein [Corynebacterium hesseae]PKZ24645.1 kinase [Corynebacterium aurimucosum]